MESLKGEGKIAHYTIEKPFPVAVDGGISTREEAYEALKKIEKRNGRFYVEEIGWWWDAYDSWRCHSVMRVTTKLNKLSAPSPKSLLFTLNSLLLAGAFLVILSL